MNNQTVAQNILDGATLTDADVIAFFDIPEQYNKPHVVYAFDSDKDCLECLEDIADKYDDSRDSVFYILDQHYIEPVDGGWFVEKMGSADDTPDQIAHGAIAEYHTDQMSAPEALSLFGLGHYALQYLDVVEDDYVGECCVWLSLNYYTGHISSSPEQHWLSDDDNDRLTFKNAKSALKAIAEIVDRNSLGDLYALAHGESSPPDYYIVAS